MMKSESFKRPFSALLIIVLWWTPLGTIANAEQSEIKTLPRLSGKSLRIEVTPGEQWLHVMNAFFMKIKAPPQVVIWIEDQGGRFIDTLFITRKMGKQFWGVQPKQDPDEVFYYEALPYWMYKRFDEGFAFPTKNAPLPDAITAASPKEAFAVEMRIQIAISEIAVLLEANISFDNNDTYFLNAPKGSSAYNKNSGQPAIVYRAEIDLYVPGRYEMKLIGHSHPAGENGELYTDLNKLTTALQMIEQVVVIVGE
jgi:hypothetical protein